MTIISRPEAKPQQYDNTWLRLHRNAAPFTLTDFTHIDMDLHGLREYPNAYESYQLIADYLKISVEEFVITHGSEQAIKFVFDAFVNKGDEVVYTAPSYGMYDVFTQSREATPVVLDLDKDRNIDVSDIIDAVTDKTSLVVMQNPDNISGKAYTFSEMYRLIETVDCQVMIDEAYFYHYIMGMHAASFMFINEHPNVILTRSFSKAWGLAGARLGLVISNPDTMKHIKSHKPAFEVNYASSVIIKKLFEKIPEYEDTDSPHRAGGYTTTPCYADKLCEANVRQVRKWKNKFALELPKMYLEASGNFILLRSDKYGEHRDRLEDNKIVCGMDYEHPAVKNCFRFSVGQDNEMRRVLEIFHD